MKPHVAEVARMGAARAAHTATLLGDGRVLVAGGCTVDGCEMAAAGATAELYDPRARRFTPAGRMSARRGGHTATRLADGTVLLAGGWDGGRQLATAELYDPRTGRFTATGSLARARGGHTATLLPDGRVLIAGGDGGVREVEVYDPRTRSFRTVGSLREPRSAHAASLLANGRVLLTGGSVRRGTVVSSAEVFDPRTGRSTATGEMTRVRHRHAAAALPDGRVLVLGGSDHRDWRGRCATAEVYDPATGRFTRVSDLRTARFKLANAVVPLANGTVLVAGGGETVEAFSPPRGEFFTAHGSLGAARQFSTATALADGSVLIVGGYDERVRPTATAWLYSGARPS
ncbi:MAG TPA: kelch repeat-containing protein [Longimicrobium sp.]